MKITIIQDKIYWANKVANFTAIENHLTALKGKTDLVVLPELFSTGFCTEQPELAETMEGATVQWLKKCASTFQLAFTGSFMATENGKTYNRSFFVFPDEKIEIADKRHLFSVGGEHTHFSAGTKKLLVNHKGFNIQVLVCYDLRFPVWARNVDNTYDLLIFVANFPEKRIRNWDILLQARAIENQSYVCGVNCVGTDGAGISYNGHSVLLDFFAAPLLSCPENETSVQTYELNTEHLHRFRTKSPFWKDADKFNYLVE
jgi:predicted amidohydrolase